MTKLNQYYQNKKILVLGGSGFIGQHLTGKLLELTSHILNADVKKLRDNQIPFAKINIQRQDHINSLIKKHQFDIIYNLAGISGVTSTNFKLGFNINVIGSLNLLEAILKYSPQSKIIFSNSRQEYGIPINLPVNEEHPTLPINLYGLQKLISTNLAQMYHSIHQLKTCVFRTSNVFGPSRLSTQTYNIVNFWINQALKNKNLKVFGKGRIKRDHLYIDDFIEALLLAGQSPKANGQIFNIGSGQGETLSQVAKTISQIIGGKVVYKPWPSDWKNNETGSYISDITKAKKLLKWQPKTDFTAAVKKIYAQVKSN